MVQIYKNDAFIYIHTTIQRNYLIQSIFDYNSIQVYFLANSSSPSVGIRRRLKCTLVILEFSCDFDPSLRAFCESVVEINKKRMNIKIYKDAYYEINK